MNDTDQDRIMEEARRWFVRLMDEQAPPADHAAFSAWMAQDPAHEAAWAHTQRLWARLDGVVPTLKLRDGGPMPAPAVVLPFARPASAKSAPAKPALERLSRRSWLKGAVAASVLVGAGGILAARSNLLADARTTVGERRTLSLPDGSVVELATASALSVRFTDNERRILLHDGEAFFQVARDTARPFIVASGDGETRALGTRFNVKRVREVVTVSVIEHAVSVTVAGDGSRVLQQGQQASYGPGRIGQTRDADLFAVQAWQQDRLVFQETPLGEVVADLERYRWGRIVITDERIARMPVSGIFHTAQTDAALQTIGDTLPVRLTRATDLLVFIQPR